MMERRSPVYGLLSPVGAQTAAAEIIIVPKLNAAWGVCLARSMQAMRARRMYGVEAAEAALAGCASEEQVLQAYLAEREVSPTLIASIRVRKKQQLAAAAHP